MNNILPFLCIFLVTFYGCNVIADDYDSYDEFKQLIKDIIAEHNQNRQDVKNRQDANEGKFGIFRIKFYFISLKKLELM